LTEKYKVELTKDEIRNLTFLCDFSFKNLRPFIPIDLIHAERKFRTILLDGCFKHNRIRVRFQINPSHSIVLCPECNPKEYKKLKKEYKEERI